MRLIGIRCLLLGAIAVLAIRSADAMQSATSFAYPQSVFVDSPNGHVWVADFDNHRVLRFDVSALTGVEKERALLVPGENVLSQNYPNPFNPATQISFSCAKSGYVQLRVFNLLGEEVASIFSGMAKAQTMYTVAFDASRMPSGMYLYSLRTADGRVLVKKLCVLK
jgi:hypothetical protein